MADRITIFASVLLPLPVPKTYTYRIPEDWNELVQIGQRVVVQFGSRKIYAGILIDFSDSPPEKYQASYLLEILDEEPLVSPSQLKFWQWVADYYMCHLGEVMAAALPAGFRLQSESVIVLNPEFDEEENLELDEKEWLILTALQKKKELRLDEAADIIGLKSPMKYIKSLYQRGIILMHEEVKENYRPKTDNFVRLSPAWEDADFAQTTLEKLEKKAPKQANVILALMGPGKGELAQRRLQSQFDVQTSHIKPLQEKGLVIIEKRQVGRLEKLGENEEEFELSLEQNEATKQIQAAFESKKPALLWGATGSGKTFVYIHFIKKAIDEGKQVLYLLPEVGITEQLVQRLAHFFGPVMGVWHHFYSSNERTELYEKVRSGELKFLVGARSAVFAPFQNLGLVVVDEEHENTFKQFDKRPHYHGRDTAIYLASIQKANVLLGSATPSYDMLQQCRNGKMLQVNLQKRFIETPEPEIVLVHTGEAKRQNRMKQAFSSAMLEEMQKVLDVKGQIIVFQNRKGYVPFISCDMCGYTAHCINCDITLTYFKSINVQKCGYCGFSQEIPNQCPACGSTSLSMRGYGTERIAEELAIFFPEARITRFDQDSIRKRSDFQRILNAYASGDIDILVGTQLLSKGLDFQNVGLVAVVDADMLMNVPDFRSHERAFQQLHQVAGRAGRGSFRGKAMLQTTQASHPVIQAVVNHNFMALANQEIPMRQLHGYPPFTRLIRVILKHKDYLVVKNAAQLMGTYLNKKLEPRVLGPQIPTIGKIRNYYLQHILVKLDSKTDNIIRIKAFLLAMALAVNKTDGFKGVFIDFDVDPM